MIFHKSDRQTLLAWSLMLTALFTYPSFANEPPTSGWRLSDSSSPYLQLHADNPVTWYPWGPEAFAKARQEGKLLFISIGYFSCHWCHVMARESFANPEIAQVLNRDFIAIKVDREQRPDIDSAYMQFVTLTNGVGGWPLTIWALPDASPLVGGSYFPPHTKEGKEGLLELSGKIQALWATQPAELRNKSQVLLAQLSQHLAPPVSSLPFDVRLVNRAEQALTEQYDAATGGFGPAPRFPEAGPLLLLLRNSSGSYASIALQSLKQMGNAEIYDQLGGGFHRYAQDVQWNDPHFEKMLYDQALMLRAYLRAYEVSHDSYYKNKAEQMLAFVQREMQAKEGGWFASLSAESKNLETGEMEEGGYYKAESMQSRSHRPPPPADDKVILAWNAWMVTTLVQAAQLLDKPEYRELAVKQMEFLVRNLSDASTGELYRSWRSGRRDVHAFATDYASMVQAALALYPIAGERWLQLAEQWMDRQVDLFWDEKEGGFWEGRETESLWIREKPYADSVMPSVNSLSLGNLVALSEVSASKQKYAERLAMQVRWLSPRLIRQPELATFAMLHWESVGSLLPKFVEAGQSK